MMRSRGFWFLAALALLVSGGVVYLQANAQTPLVPQPLITEALVDVEHAALTINGYDFPASVPEVTLGMTELAVVSATESAVVTGLPELLPGTYLLAATWPEGVGAVFFLTVGAVGPAGPQGLQGPQGGSAAFLSSALDSPSTPAAGEGAAADDGGTFTPQDHTDSSTNTHLGARTLESVTTGTGNTAVGQQTLRSLTTGLQNAGFGWQTLRSLTTGRSNLAIGTASMVRVTDGSFNTAIGSDTLKATLSGQDNVAIGTGALLFSLGNQNVGIGRSALRRNEEGSGNIAIGYGAGNSSITGSNNVYIGNAGVRDEEGTIRIGTEGVHNRIYLAGEVHLAGGGVAAVYQ